MSTTRQQSNVDAKSTDLSGFYLFSTMSTFYTYKSIKQGGLREYIPHVPLYA